jgi:hypothetical protein
MSFMVTCPLCINLPSLMDFPLQYTLAVSLKGESEEWWNDIQSYRRSAINTCYATGSRTEMILLDMKNLVPVVWHQVA